MKCFIGIDLGSTTTKAVILDENSRILGKGLTNSRSNYDVACAISKSEAVVDARLELLQGITAALSDVLESPAELRDAQLVEEPELAMLVKTHAPSDTLVFSTRLRIEVRGELITAHSHLLVEPKYLSRLLSALSAASH